MNTKIGPMIKSARIRKGWSQAELADKAGVSQAAIGHWERGTFTPRGKNLNVLSELLEIALQPDLPLPELDDLKEPSSSTQYFGGSLSDCRGPDGKVASDPKSRAADFAYCLTVALPDFDNTVRIGAQSSGPKHDAWQVDLMSERTVIEVKHPNTYHRIEEVIERALWRLAFFQAFFGEHMLYVALIRRPQVPPEFGGIPPAHERAITRLAAEADMVGIHLVLVDSVEEAVQEIRELETSHSNDE